MDTKDISPSLQCGDKEARGYHHAQTARLLYPAKYLAEFDKNQEVYADCVSDYRAYNRSTNFSPFLRAYAGIIELVSEDKSSATFFPAFMYKDCRFELDAMDKGCTQHYITVRVREKIHRTHVDTS